jgi:hypothetical protein
VNTGRTLPWLLALLGAGAIVWLLAGPRATRPPLQEPLDVQKLEPSVGAPPPEKVKQMLDEVEAAEAQKFGPEEAKRRRERREELLPQRLERR